MKSPLREQPYRRPCTPPAWARGGHAQTLWGHLLPVGARELSTDSAGVRHEVPLPDGDRLVVRAFAGTSGLRVHLFHGLSGSADADYMRRTAHALRARGHAVWAVNHRGCGEGRGLARGPYHAGSAEDLAAVLQASREDGEDARHVAIGFSLSGNALVLGLARGLVPEDTGWIAVCPPVDIARTTDDLRRGLRRLYELRFLWRLRRAVRERRLDGLAERDVDIPLFASLRAFDGLYTAPEGGFRDADDYYARCSCGPHLADVRTPGVVLAAADDPFVDPRAYDAVRVPEEVLLHLERTGGHVGFLERRGRGIGRWLDEALVHYVEALA